VRWVLAMCLAVTAAQAQETVRYQVEVALVWDGAAQAGHPADKHWSRLIAFAHTARYALFDDGDTATSGLALVATNGRVSVLEAELAEGVAAAGWARIWSCRGSTRALAPLPLSWS